jgi:uncharacterized protein YndB with AHSA1/START domain
MNRIGQLDIQELGENELLFTRFFKAPPEHVFRAQTEPQLIKRWLLGPPGWTMPECTVDLRVGGRLRYVWAHEDGRSMGMGGVFREINAPGKLVHSELFDEDWTGGETLATIVLTAQGGGTLYTLTVRYSSANARTRAQASGMTGGMEASYEMLESVLAGMS